jgi:hypothetical protein
MSLVGSLEDLGLGDILQIVSLAQKSGCLLLRTTGQSGHILVSDGRVRGAAIKGDPEDLRGLLVTGGHVSPGAFERARERVAERGIELEQALVEVAGLPRERLDVLRREQVERAVIRMFGWRSGEFSFDVCDVLAAEDDELLLPIGINTQYLAMEATRLRDEESLELEGEEPEDDDPVFSGELPAPGPVHGNPARAAAVDAMALAAARSVTSGAADQAEDTQPEVDHRPSAPVRVQESAVDRPVEVSVDVGAGAAPDVAPTDLPPLVAIDGNLTGLEWLKLCLGEDFPRVHIFQREETGMDRIRRYLARGVVPLVALSLERFGPDGENGELVKRMRSLSAQMPILALLAGGEAEAPEGFDGALMRPVGLLPDPAQWDVYEPLAEQLRLDLGAVVQRARERSPPRRPDATSVLQGLRSVSDRLRDPLRRDDVLTLVLEFAAGDLSRLAVFMLRDDVAIGMAQCGMAKAGGPGGSAIGEIRLRRDELPALFEQALVGRHGVRGRLSGSAGSRLAQLLGGRVPRQAYVAPIESGGCIAALLYGDNLPDDAPIADMTALEVVLHEAGLALDRALLERALADARATPECDG